jgi:hypothetical protein
MQRITQVGILSLAKIMGITGFLVGLLFGLFYGGGLMLFGAALGGAAENGAGLAIAGVGGGLFVMVAAPITLGVAYFIVGLIHGVLINIVLSLAGGLELRITETAPSVRAAK